MKIELEIDQCFFYSAGDEALFFEGLKRIKAIHEVKGYGQILALRLSLSEINQQSLRDLFGLLSRYNIPLRPLSGLAKKKNYSWLHNAQAYWYKELFEPIPTLPSQPITPPPR